MFPAPFAWWQPSRFCQNFARPQCAYAMRVFIGGWLLSGDGGNSGLTATAYGPDFVQPHDFENLEFVG